MFQHMTLKGQEDHCVLLRRTQELERQKGIPYGVILVVLGIACNVMSGTVTVTEARNLYPAY